MRIVVLGSSKFRSEKVSIRDKLLEQGEEAIIDDWTEKLSEGGSESVNFLKRMEVEHSDIKKEYDFIRWYFDEIKKSDAVIVCNFDKNGVKNYIGSNTLMEIGIAYNYKKKIFILNQVPKELYCYDEVIAVEPTFIEGDLSKIRDFSLSRNFNEENKRSLSFKEISEKAFELETELDLTTDDVLNKLTQEFGEFNDEVQKMRGRYCRTKKTSPDDAKGELGDLVFNLISICNRMGINPNDLNLYAENTLKKFQERKEDYKHGAGLKK